MKKWVWQLHSWLGLVCGAGLLVVGLTGSVLVFEDELDALRRPSVYCATPTPAGRLSFDVLFTAAGKALPGWTISDWDVPANPRLTDRLRAFPPGERKEIRKLHIDPYTGELRGQPATYPQTLSGFFLILHTELFGGTTGATAVGVFGAGLMILGISGVWLYRGFWKNFLTLRWNRSARIFFSDLHKSLGITSVAFNLVVGFTGVWWTSERVYSSLTRPTEGERPVAASVPFTLPQEGVSLDAMAAAASGQLSGFRLTNLSFPSTQEGEIVLTGSVASSNPFRSTYGSHVSFAVLGGAVKDVRDIRRAALGAQIYDMFVPLHYGTFGGWPIKVLWCLGGIAPGILATSGFIVWKARKRSKTQRLPVLQTDSD